MPNRHRIWLVVAAYGDGTSSVRGAFTSKAKAERGKTMFSSLSQGEGYYIEGPLTLDQVPRVRMEDLT